MFWIVVGTALVVVLFGAWVYDRRWGFQHDRVEDAAQRGMAQSDAAVSQRRDGGMTGC